ncbi:MAG: hypothetical protein EOO65_02370 [Methanosarcinales archaeon]|nr:MAG: hypothetical protein EOO65_02370 [Methanosarcinales archaeon]
MPNTLSIALPGAHAPTMVHTLASAVALSAGAACHSAASPSSAAAMHASHVLTAMHVPSELAVCTLRMSLGAFSTEEDMRRAASLIADAAVSVCAHAGHAAC